MLARSATSIPRTYFFKWRVLDFDKYLNLAGNRACLWRTERSFRFSNSGEITIVAHFRAVPTRCTHPITWLGISTFFISGTACTCPWPENVEIYLQLLHLLGKIYQPRRYCSAFLLRWTRSRTAAVKSRFPERSQQGRLFSDCRRALVV